MIKWVIGIIVIVVAVIVISIGAYLAPNDLKHCDATPGQDTNCQAADAIVAVSGGDTLARTDEAIDLYKHGWAPLLIFSGAAQDTSGPSNALAMRRHAVEQGVPESVIQIEEFSRNTAENAANTSTFIANRDIKRIILVTSPYHQRRASLEFSAKLGPTVRIVNHPASHDRQWSSMWWVTPGGWWLALGEMAKIIAYYTGNGDRSL